MTSTDNEMTTVEINIDDTELFELMKLAHVKDITFNKLVEELLQQYIDSYKLLI
jgi:hypothetical protein